MSEDLNSVACSDYHATQSKRREGVLSVDMSRRGLLSTVSLGLVSWLGSSALAQVQVGGKDREKVLVVIFLRGGADGLNMVVPYRDDFYHKARPTIDMKAPGDTRVPAGRRVLDLNGEFGLHPALAPLHELYKEGKMAVMHACGSNDGSRSHFEAMATMERGMDRPGSGDSSGWLGRVLTEYPGTNPSPLQTLAFGYTMPDALRGAPNALSLESVGDFKLDAPEDYVKKIAKMYAPGKDAVSDAGRQTLAVLDKLKALNLTASTPSNGATYPDSSLAKSLKEVAALIRSDVGLEYAYLDKDGWDTHVAQGADVGWLQLLSNDLATSIHAFTKDLGKDLDRTTIVVQTEFGRRVEENTGLGTDHGRASVAFVIGGGVKGGRIVGAWPGLGPTQVDSVGDLRPVNDYRVMLQEVLRDGLGVPANPFRNLPDQKLGLFRA